VRKSELRLARWSHVDLAIGEWTVPEYLTKNKKPHTIYLSSQVSRMFGELKTLAGDSEFLSFQAVEATRDRSAEMQRTRRNHIPH
jgi:integrase